MWSFFSKDALQVKFMDVQSYKMITCRLDITIVFNLTFMKWNPVLHVFLSVIYGIIHHNKPMDTLHFKHTTTHLICCTAVCSPGLYSSLSSSVQVWLEVVSVHSSVIPFSLSLKTLSCLVQLCQVTGDQRFVCRILTGCHKKMSVAGGERLTSSEFSLFCCVWNFIIKTSLRHLLQNGKLAPETVKTLIDFRPKILISLTGWWI